MPRLFIGNLAADGAVPVTGGRAWDEANLRHIWQDERKVFMQFVMPGQ